MRLRDSDRGRLEVQQSMCTSQQLRSAAKPSLAFFLKNEMRKYAPKSEAYELPESVHAVLLLLLTDEETSQVEQSHLLILDVLFDSRCAGDQETSSKL